MKPAAFVRLAFVLSSALACTTLAAEPVEPLLRDSAPGAFVQSSTAASAQQSNAIGQKLGGDITRLTNSVLTVHGKPIKVNVITAANDAGARSIEQSLLKIKPFPFCVRKGPLVVEYVLNDIDAALATKTSYELGVLPKPKTIRYRLTAELAAVDRADYMSCNPLFNHFITLGKSPTDETRQQIRDLASKFTFGRQLALRNPALSTEKSSYTLQPTASESKDTGPNTTFSFTQLPEREGVPFVTATLDVTTNDSGLLPTQAAPDKLLTSATAFWPSDDAQLKALAQKITAGQTTNDAKANAILLWLAPGKNIKYSGQTGSRWGTDKVFDQKFGHCWDFSDAFVTLSRAAGVPSRQVAGWLYGSSGHVWAEYFAPGQGWQQVDPTGGGALKCGLYHIPYFTSDDGHLPIVYLSLPKIEIAATK